MAVEYGRCLDRHLGSEMKALILGVVCQSASVSVGTVEKLS